MEFIEPKFNENFNKDFEDKENKDTRMFWQTIYIPAIIGVIIAIGSFLLSEYMHKESQIEIQKLKELQQINAKLDSVLSIYNSKHTNMETSSKSKIERK